MRVACTLRPARHAQDFSIRKAEELTGVPRGTLSQIERGRVIPTDDQAAAIERVYGVDRHDFYEFAGTEPLIKGDDA